METPHVRQRRGSRAHRRNRRHRRLSWPRRAGGWALIGGLAYPLSMSKELKAAPVTLVTAAEVVSLAIWLPSGLHSCGPPTLVAPRTFQWNPMTQLDAGQPRGLILAEDVEHPGLWRIEWFDSAGAVYITVFAGPSAGERARDYHDAIRDGRLRTHLARSSR